jgi:methylenetetrahydrofolate reductase (NADPH)
MTLAERPGAVSRLHAELASGRFVITAEVSPPVSTDPHDFLAKALPLRDVAAAVNVTDGAGAKAHLSSLVAAHFLLQNGVEPILQITCRDRNRIAIQGDLLGASALGIRNVLVLGGDDPKSGDQPETKPVYDLRSSDLLALAHRMRSEQRLPPGTPIEGGLRLVLGGAETPVDPAPGWEPKGLEAKLAAGADFIQTQFCMDAGVARRYAARLLERGIAQRLPILIGVAPLPSARSARWVKKRLFGAVIPDALVARLERAADPKAEGKAICVELLRELARIPGIAGAHIMAPTFASAVPEVIAASGVVGAARP